MDLPLNYNRPLIMHMDLNSCFAMIEQQANPLSATSRLPWLPMTPHALAHTQAGDLGAHGNNRSHRLKARGVGEVTLRLPGAVEDIVERQPMAATCTTTSCSPGVGMGISTTCKTSGPPYLPTRMAFMSFPFAQP